MIEEIYKIEDEILDNVISTDFILTIDGNDIPFENIVAESFELENSICDEEEFKLGGCIVSQMKIQLIDVFEDFSSKPVSVKIKQGYTSGIITPDTSLVPSLQIAPLYTIKETQEYPLFTGTVYSCKRQKNRNIREIIAFDDLYSLSKLTIKQTLQAFKNKAWYDENGLPRNPNMSELLDWVLFGTKFYNRCNRFYPTILYPNATAEVVIRKLNIRDDIDDDTTVLEFLGSICEINTCFAFVNGKGELIFKTLYDYDSEKSEITRKSSCDIPTYSSLKFEEYTMKPINMIKFATTASGDDESKYFAYGSSYDNSIYISDNLLTKICPAYSSLILNLKKGENNYIFRDLYIYRPFSADIFGRWWIEVGDKVKLPTVYADIPMVESFVLSRKIKGINAMTCTIEAKGVEYLGKDEKKYE